MIFHALLPHFPCAASSRIAAACFFISMRRGNKRYTELTFFVPNITYDEKGMCIHARSAFGFMEQTFSHPNYIL